MRHPGLDEPSFTTGRSSTDRREVCGSCGEAGLLAIVIECGSVKRPTLAAAIRQ
jgi:hypothetical protein